jgi:hypothetical protein
MLTNEIVTQRQALMADLVSKFENRKLNLRHSPSGLVKVPFNGSPVGNEGIWVVPADQDAFIAMTSDHSVGVKFRAYLANDLIGSEISQTWGGLTWGAEVIGRSNGEERPYAILDDQIDEEVDKRNAIFMEAYRPVLAAEIARAQQAELGRLLIQQSRNTGIGLMAGNED